MSSSLTKGLGRVVRRLRAERGFSQEGFAHHIGVHRTYMGAVERGEKNISLASVERLARALEVRVSTLLAEAEQARQGPLTDDRSRGAARSPQSGVR